MKCKRILISGSTGFIGKNLINYLYEQNYIIYCTYRNRKANFNPNITYIKQDLKQPLEIDNFPNVIDCIIHLAGNMSKKLKNSELYQINTISTLNLLEFGKTINIKNFIFSSTGGVYGYSTHSHKEESERNPIDFYGVSKYESELLVKHYLKFFSTTILRLFFPYGIGQTNGIIPKIINKIENNEPVYVYNNDNPKINPIYISDVVKAISKSINLEGQNIFNIAGNDILSIKELAKLISKHIKSDPVFKYVEDNSTIDLIGNNTRMLEKMKISPILIEDGIKKIFMSV